MITFVNNEEHVAVPFTAGTANIVFAVYSSWEAFISSDTPLSTHDFNGANNYAAVEQFFAGWTKVCRDDLDWSVVECGPLPEMIIPNTVSARQIRLWLILNGISMAQIETLIDNITDQQHRDYTRVEWEYAPYIERTHPMVATFAAALGLTEAQVDAGFIEAANM